MSMSSLRSLFRDPLVLLMILLSAVTGLVDAVSVLGLGKVFTANMTGNVVFLGFAIVGVPGFDWTLYVTGLVCFAIGAALAGRLGKACAGKGRRRWLIRAALVETGLLWISAGFAVGMRPISPGAEAFPWAGYVVIALSAVAMGSRNATARQLKVPDLTTTVLTLTITGLASDSRLGGGGSPNLARRVAAVLAILFGAMLGAAMLITWGLVPPLLLSGTCVLAATLWLARDEEDSAVKQ